MGKIIKQTPHKRRIYKCSLISLHQYIEDIDLIGIIFEYITRKTNEEFAYGDYEACNAFDRLKEQTGIDAYNDILRFVKYLENKYVIDYENNRMCTDQPYVLILPDGSRVTWEGFNCDLILEELYKYSKT